MSSDWQVWTIGDVCTKVYSGGTPASTKAVYYGGNIPWLRTKEVNYGKIFATEQHITELGLKESSAKLVPINSVIVAMYGNGDTAGRVAINKIPLTTNQACCNLVVDPAKADYRFVYYYLKGKYQELVDLKNGGAQQNLNGQLIKAFPLVAPVLSEQIAIADILEDLDDRITLLRETNTTLESIAQTLFKSWFVDYDPVRSKMDGRVPECIDEATAALFPDGFEDGSMGTVPKGWRHTNIGEIASVIDCLHSKKPSFLEQGKPYLQLNNIRDDGLLDITKLASISQEDYAKWISRIEVACGDCVITNVGRVGAVSQIPEGFKAAMGRNMTAIRLKPDWSYPTYLIELLLSAEMKSEIERKTDTGTILNALNVRSIPLLRCLLAPHDVMEKFEAISRPLRASMETNLGRIQTLANLRDTLLPRLISGQLRIPEAEVQLDALAA